ncbi:MAG: hypothetical protein HC826_01035, partial [Rhodospirillales bacterium]|nr:hypothetical protein [Rhodospirillales bacterium]
MNEANVPSHRDALAGPRRIDPSVASSRVRTYRRPLRWALFGTALALVVVVAIWPEFKSRTTRVQVSEAIVAEKVGEAIKVELSPQNVILATHFKRIGDYAAIIRLHSEVEIEISLTVAPE